MCSFKWDIIYFTLIYQILNYPQFPADKINFWLCDNYTDVTPSLCALSIVNNWDPSYSTYDLIFPSDHPDRMI